VNWSACNPQSDRPTWSISAPFTSSSVFLTNLNGKLTKPLGVNAIEPYGKAFGIACFLEQTLALTGSQDGRLSASGMKASTAYSAAMLFWTVGLIALSRWQLSSRVALWVWRGCGLLPVLFGARLIAGP
jgi:hypothetical protein